MPSEEYNKNLLINSSYGQSLSKTIKHERIMGKTLSECLIKTTALIEQAAIFLFIQNKYFIITFLRMIIIISSKIKISLTPISNNIIDKENNILTVMKKFPAIIYQY